MVLSRLSLDYRWLNFTQLLDECKIRCPACSQTPQMAISQRLPVLLVSDIASQLLLLAASTSSVEAFEKSPALN